MGLLDEAIRDHLELRRRHGADPSEVAREEHEALDSVFPDEQPRGLDDFAHADDHGGFAASDGHFEASSDHQALADPDGLAEETVEMDMEAFLAADAQLEAQQVGQASGPVRAPLATAMEDESLEWELPDRATAEPPPDPLPGQEHLPFE